MSIFKIYVAKSLFCRFTKDWEAMPEIIRAFQYLLEESGEISLVSKAWDFYAAIYTLDFSFSDIFKRANESLDQLLNINFLCYQAVFLGGLAENCLIRGKIQEGLHTITKSQKSALQIHEKLYLADLYRIQGDLLLLGNEIIAAEQAFHQAIEIAQPQSAKWFELLASKSLAHLWKSQGKTQQAYDLLHPVYNWFTEGFDTVDLKEAKVLLGELEKNLN